MTLAPPDRQDWAAGAVESLVAPLPLDRFISEHWGREFLRMPGGSGRFVSLFGWDELGRILADENFALEDLKLYKSGQQLEQSAYTRHWRGRTTLKPGSMVQLASDGATLILDNVHRLAPAVRSLALECERVFAADTTVNLYAGWRTQPGFGLHWDPQDTMILQVAGRKAWKVFGPTRLHPRRDDVEIPSRPTQAPVWEGFLQQGEVLYLPRGWWHSAQAVDEPSLHLTVTVVPPAGPDLLAWIGERLMRNSDFRMNLPVAPSAMQQAAYVSSWRRMLADALEGNVLEQFFAEWRSRLPIAHRFDLPDAVAQARCEFNEDTSVRLAANAHLAFSTQPDGRASFLANDVWWHCAPAFVPALAQLRSDRSFTIRALGALLAEPAQAKALTTFLTVLAMGGAVSVDVNPPRDA
jgi:ribosomal protein L16 Arg81 hydroxylase